MAINDEKLCVKMVKVGKKVKFKTAYGVIRIMLLKNML